MYRTITDFFLDEHDDWVALLSCGHTQHVRHDPPWQNRKWVITSEGRDSRLGQKLNCKQCDSMAAELDDD